MLIENYNIAEANSANEHQQKNLLTYLLISLTSDCLITIKPGAAELYSYCNIPLRLASFLNHLFSLS